MTEALAPIAADIRMICYVFLWLIFMAWAGHDAVARAWMAATMHFLVGFFMLLSGYFILFGYDARIAVYITTPVAVFMVLVGLHRALMEWRADG